MEKHALWKIARSATGLEMWPFKVEIPVHENAWSLREATKTNFSVKFWNLAQLA